jgi:hypothetical protein
MTTKKHRKILHRTKKNTTTTLMISDVLDFRYKKVVYFRN